MGVGKAADPGAGGEEQSAEVGEAGQKRTFPPSPSKKSPEKKNQNTQEESEPATLTTPAVAVPKMPASTTEDLLAKALKRIEMLEAAVSKQTVEKHVMTPPSKTSFSPSPPGSTVCPGTSSESGMGQSGGEDHDPEGSGDENGESSNADDMIVMPNGVKVT